MDRDTTGSKERVSTLAHKRQLGYEFKHSFSTLSTNPLINFARAESPRGLSPRAVVEAQQMEQHLNSVTTTKSTISSHDTTLRNESISFSPSGSVRQEAMPVSATRSSGWWDPSAMNPPKIGARFSRESSKVLLQWYTANVVYPYPSKEDMKVLQQQTSLGKAQIRNWLANRRRRKKIGEALQIAATVRSNTEASVMPVNIPTRAGTLSDNDRYKEMAPLQRWFESTAEIESATAADIVTALKAAEYSHGSVGTTDAESCTSMDEPSRCSYQAPSGNSLRSTQSRNSRESCLVNGTANTRSGYKSRHQTAQIKARTSSVAIKHLQFQCTFCAETFKTKYDWQRHEKSLHVSLERWVCSPKGTRAVNPENGVLSCVFCGKHEPTDEHINGHNPNSCQERIFTRKDHLMQHLCLVHKSKLVKWVTEDWKAPEPTIRSNCGFCGILLDSWLDRVEHLADHFKMGKTMADWIGDWGLDHDVLNKLENSFLPDLHDTRANSNSPETGAKTNSSLCNAYKVLNSELSLFVESYKHEHSQVPDHSMMQLEAFRIASAPKFLPSSKEKTQSTNTGISWLRDLISDNNALAAQAQYSSLQTPAEGQQPSLEITGERPIFTECPLETQLHQFVFAERRKSAVAISDIELQEEACRIMTRMHLALGLPLTDFTFNWLTSLARSSTSWLVHFRQRANLPSVEIDCGYSPSLMLEFAATPRTSILPATNAEYHCAGSSTTGQDLESYNEPNCGVASRPPFTVGIAEPCDSVLATPPSIIDIIPSSQPTTPSIFQDQFSAGENLHGNNAIIHPVQLPSGQASSTGQLAKATVALAQPNEVMYQMHDANFTEWLDQQLSHWVTGSSSPDYPSRHIPSDQEIQYHARYLMNYDDSSWHQPAADNME